MHHSTTTHTQYQVRNSVLPTKTPHSIQTARSPTTNQRSSQSRNDRSMNNSGTKYISARGYTLPEMLTTVAILGVLTSIAAPSYFSQLVKAKQNSCIVFTTTTLSAVVGAAGDAPPVGWDDVNNYSAVMTTSGPAKGSDFLNQLVLNEDYKFSITDSNPLYESQCIPINSSLANYNVLGCVNIITGAFQIKEGDGSTPATKPTCN